MQWNKLATVTVSGLWREAHTAIQNRETRSFQVKVQVEVISLPAKDRKKKKSRCCRADQEHTSSEVGRQLLPPFLPS